MKIFEIHVVKVNRETHLFQLVDEGMLRSYCGLKAIPNYEFKNLKNIFYNNMELEEWLKNQTSESYCDICKKKSE